MGKRNHHDSTKKMITPQTILALEEKAYHNAIDADDALLLLESNNTKLFDIIASANRIRIKNKGNKISLCSIINAKSGRCGEDCAFCSQSSRHTTTINEFPLVNEQTILSSADKARTQSAHKFGIVTSGKSISAGSELKTILDSISEVSTKMHCCASLGILSKEMALQLKKAGLKEYHHNLETAKSFFPSICSTHTYEENEKTVKIVKEAGLRICCGGIFGMGESKKQRVELAIALKELDVDSIPLNFLNPIKGTRLETAPLLKPFEILRIIAMFRFLHPKKDIKVAGGREVGLRDMQSFIFAAGANSTMVGNYLTTKGRSYQDDIQMIQDLELEIAEDGFCPSNT